MGRLDRCTWAIVTALCCSCGPIVPVDPVDTGAGDDTEDSTSTEGGSTSEGGDTDPQGSTGRPETTATTSDDTSETTGNQIDQCMQRMANAETFLALNQDCVTDEDCVFADGSCYGGPQAMCGVVTLSRKADLAAWVDISVSLAECNGCTIEELCEPLALCSPVGRCELQLPS